MQKIILFDIDDTLFPSTEFALLARRNAIRAMINMGIGKSEDDLYEELVHIIQVKGSNYSRHFDELCKKLKVAKPARFIAAAVAAYHNTKTSIQPYPAVPRTLLALRELGYSLYIASNGSAKKQWDKLIRLRIALYFEDVFVSEVVGMEKGEAFFKKVLKSLDTLAQNALMVGDKEEADIRPAKKLGLSTIRIKKGKYSDNETDADFEITEFSDILQIIKSLKTPFQ
jgi:putative hydrolase of the HAD superfamily